MTPQNAERSSSHIRNGGFTLVVLITTIAILGVLTAISVPTFSGYRMRAEYIVVQTTLDFLMDAEDIYFIENDEFYPNTGRINVRKARERSIPELAYTFPSGHKHRYIIYGRNIKRPRRTVNMYYVEIRADYDFNGNGRDDRFRYTTLIRNGKQISYREFRQYR